MLPDRVSDSGPLTYESGALPIAPVAKIQKERHVVLILITTFCLVKGGMLM